MYDAVKLYAETADKVLKSGGDLRNGTLVIETMIKEKKYRSDILGIDVSSFKKETLAAYWQKNFQLSFQDWY